MSRRTGKPGSIGRRCRVTELEDGRWEFTWPCGHVRREVPWLQIPGRGKVPMSPVQRAIIKRTWQDGVQWGPCPTCKDKAPRIDGKRDTIRG